MNIACKQELIVEIKAGENKAEEKMENKNRKNIEDGLWQLDIETGIPKSTSAVRDFLVSKFDEVIEDKEE